MSRSIWMPTSRTISLITRDWISKSRGTGGTERGKVFAASNHRYQKSWKMFWFKEFS